MSLVRIAAELEEAVGATATAAKMIANHVATTYLDGTADHAADELADLDAEIRGAAMIIAFSLVEMTRLDGGPSCPDMARPTAFAASAVRAAVASLN